MKAVEVAKKYIGEKELVNNSGFVSAEFQKKMIGVGWIKGQAWCCYFAELVWKEAYPDLRGIFDRLFAPSATATYKNFDVDKDFTVSKVPVPGALAVWRQGTGWQGHIGVVQEIIGDTFKCIEGNTNSEGGREGIEVAVKNRKVDYKVGANKLNLIGFVIPPKQ
jgi:hypothetical protein